ncbi:MAG: tetratricopeptide repeat protein [Cyanobacteriota bacterium]|nr:tetratricopeptide repeat protein [Cyanobacteriota bacterium]
MARKHLGFVVSSLLSLWAAWVVVPSTALATRRLDPVRGSLAESSAVEVAPLPTLSERARQLEEHAGALYGQGRYGEALQAQRDSVASHRQLVAQDPSQRLRLAASLHNLGVVLIRLGRKGDAIPPTLEALTLYRGAGATEAGEAALAQERPLRNLVLLYFETNRPQEALPLADELVRHHQRAAIVDAASQASQIDVFNLRASLLVALNRPREALRDLERAVAMARQQATQTPEMLALRHGLAGSLLNQSQVADLLGQPREAIPPAQEAEALLRELARLHPAINGDWAKALSRLGQAYAKTGDAARARPPLETAVVLLRGLDPAGPSGSLAVEVGGYRDDLAHALDSLALVNQQLQRPAEARAAGEEALRLYSTLARVDPRYQADVQRMRAWLSPGPEIIPARR